MGKPAISKEKQKAIALEQISSLFQRASTVFSENKTLANRYVALARTMAMKVKLRLPRELKRQYCKHCHAYLRAGVNARVRTHSGRVIISCFECKKFTRIPIHSPKKL